MPNLLDPHEAAQALHVSRTTLYRLIERREIPFFRVSGSLRFSHKDLARYLDAMRVESLRNSYEREEDR